MENEIDGLLFLFSMAMEKGDLHLSGAQVEIQV